MEHRDRNGHVGKRKATLWIGYYPAIRVELDDEAKRERAPHQGPGMGVGLMQGLPRGSMVSWHRKKRLGTQVGPDGRWKCRNRSINSVDRVWGMIPSSDYKESFMYSSGQTHRCCVRNSFFVGRGEMDGGKADMEKMPLHKQMTSGSTMHKGKAIERGNASNSAQENQISRVDMSQ